MYDVKDMKLEDITQSSFIEGLIPGQVVQILSAQWVGSNALNVVMKSQAGTLTERLVFRSDEPTLKAIQKKRAYGFDADASKLRLVSEAHRIRLAHLFDPYLAIHTSTVQPLPHQITAVYREMLTRQPLRFLLADDPGAGKTVMAGLLIKELRVRGDLERCLVVAPGGLVEQWQDELSSKFNLEFQILTRDRLQASHTGDVFSEAGLWIARMDMLSRNEDLQAKLDLHDWDLVVVDEAHRMSATVFGSEPKFTRRYNLGKRLSNKTRHFLLMSATPHNGKEDEFQLFMALLDGDRFEGKARDGAHTVDASDMMRRLVKEELVKFDGRPLFPERRSYTVTYPLSDDEASLYSQVTDYVREEMNRAERIDPTRRVNVGFALQTLQRRLASSPEAIYQSLRRRRERLEARLREENLNLRGGGLPSEDEWADVDDLSEDEIQALEQQVVDRATAASTVQELTAEIETLKGLEASSLRLRNSGRDTKWQELSSILSDPLMVSPQGNRRKLIIFSEARDTLNYLAERIRTHLGKTEEVEIIHGGVSREERRNIVERFNHGGELKVLIANDAAGEGLNLQTAHLMVNYDLPWNPNRLEQRFGRIHRIGQEEVCHLWNLVAQDTREGEVYYRLLQKLDIESQALGGRVFDVLGDLFQQTPLRDLLMEAVRYGDRPEVKSKLNQVIEGSVDRTSLRKLLDDRALTHDSMDMTQVQLIREDMERAEARKLQPHFIQSFFLAAFQDEAVGGSLQRREEGRYVVNYVPAKLRDRDRLIGTGEVLLKRYERICFNKGHIRSHPIQAAFVCPGHPLLDTTLDVIIEQYGFLLKQGTVFIDPNNQTTEPRVLAYLEHEVRDGRPGKQQPYTVISKRLQFVELSRNGEAWDAGYAPYLDYRAATPGERELLDPLMEEDWLQQNLEERVLAHAINEVIPRHVEEVRTVRLQRISKVEQEVRRRLGREINYWDARAYDLKQQEAAGKQPKVNSQKAQERATELHERLERRMGELNLERAISAGVPTLRGIALVVPTSYIDQLLPQPEPFDFSVDAEARKRIELAAMNAVIDAERKLGREPRDVSSQRGLGYDIESKDPQSGRLFFIEVKGRIADADTVTLTKNEILASRNLKEHFRLALVGVETLRGEQPRLIGDRGTQPTLIQKERTTVQYLSDYSFPEPGFAEVGRTFNLSDLQKLARSPH